MEGLYSNQLNDLNGSQNYYPGKSMVIILTLVV